MLATLVWDLGGTKDGLLSKCKMHSLTFMISELVFGGHTDRPECMSLCSGSQLGVVRWEPTPKRSDTCGRSSRIWQMFDESSRGSRALFIRAAPCRRGGKVEWRLCGGGRVVDKRGWQLSRRSISLSREIGRNRSLAKSGRRSGRVARCMGRGAPHANGTS